jgi:hypothetical protein
LLLVGACGSNDETGTQLSVLLLKLADPALEIGELGFAAVAGVLGGDAVTVGAGLLAVL